MIWFRVSRPRNEWAQTHTVRGRNLGHHATPSDQLGVDFLAFFLLMRDDGLQETVEMLVAGIIVLVKGLETLGEIHGQ